MSASVCRAVFALGLALLVALPSSAQKRKQEPQPPRLGHVTIDRYEKGLIWIPETNYIRSPGPVRIILTDATTGEKTVLVADDAEGQANGDIIVHGAVRVERPEGLLAGRSLTYNGDTQTGSVLEARAEVNGMNLSGARIDLLPGRVIRATNASFTTCEGPNPHYHITAKRIEVNANRRVKAKGVTFWLGRVRIISLPEVTKSFNGAAAAGIPLPGYSKETGIHMRFRDDVISDASTLLSYDVVLSTKRTPTGAASYARDLGSAAPDANPPRDHLAVADQPLRSALEATPPPTLRSLSSAPPEPHPRTSLYALLTGQAYVYNRKRTDLQVSRLPEVGIALTNVMGQTAQAGAATSPFGVGLFRPRTWFVSGDLGIGYFHENPTGVDSARLGLRAEAASPLIQLAGAFRTRYGLSLWANAYSHSSHGSLYSILAPEAELDYLINKSTLVGAAYLFQQDFGSTPFLFDREDIAHELRLRVGHSGPHWAFDLSVNFDLERQRAYDTLASVVHRLDCMEFGIGYRARSQSFSLIFNLLPAKAPDKVAAAPDGR